MRNLVALLAHAVAAAGPALAGVPDRELLRRFRHDRDEPAFAELVRRHARLVWAACRHQLPTDADAEDAFQATFPALARHPGAVRDGNRLGPFLHRVAVRVCSNARRSAARRKSREQVAGRVGPGQAVPDSAWDTALAAVHAEAALLPEALRVPFVMCCLEGKGATEAADLLGWKLGTLSGRLTRAKQTLLARLEARGLSAGAVVAATAAGVPVGAVARAIEITRPSVAVAGSVLHLSQGVIGMTVLRMKLIAATMVVAGGLTTTVGSGWLATADAQTPEAKKDRTGMVAMSANALSAKPVTPHPPAKWEYRYDTFNQAGGNARPLSGEFEKRLEQAEADGWQFVGEVNLRVGTAEKWNGGPALVFRRPKAADSNSTTAETNSQSETVRRLQGAEKAEWLSRQRQAVREQQLQAEVQQLRANLDRLSQTGIKDIRVPATEMPLDPIEMNQVLTPLIRKRFGDAGQLSINVGAKELFVRGRAEEVDWAVGVIKKLNEK